MWYYNQSSRLSVAEDVHNVHQLNYSTQSSDCDRGTCKIECETSAARK